MTRQITAFSNPLIKQVRGLREKKNRRAEGLFLAEGLRILTEAREAGRLPEVLLFASGFMGNNRMAIDLKVGCRLMLGTAKSRINRLGSISKPTTSSHAAIGKRAGEHQAYLSGEKAKSLGSRPAKQRSRTTPSRPRKAIPSSLSKATNRPSGQRTHPKHSRRLILFVRC